jgi:hypothetical protein
MKPGQIKEQFEALSAQIRVDHWICKGSAIERQYSRPTSKRSKTYGPYYSWTRKVDNKTVTTALTQEQYVLVRKAIAEQQRMDRTLQKLHDLSMRFILATNSVPKRKKIKQPT